jgi:hypothetical protein
MSEEPAKSQDWARFFALLAVIAAGVAYGFMQNVVTIANSGCPYYWCPTPRYQTPIIVSAIPPVGMAIAVGLALWLVMTRRVGVAIGLSVCGFFVATLGVAVSVFGPLLFLRWLGA